MPTHPWQPLSCEEVAALLTGVSFPWWICGGYAVDLFLGRATRPHADVDLGILRRDQPSLYGKIPEFEVHLARTGTLRELSVSERRAGLHAPDHTGLWCRPRGGSSWAVQVLLNDGDRAQWVFRRHPAIRRPLREVVAQSGDGIPYLVPEVQLLFKAKAPHEKDERDFQTVLPALSAQRRRWLREALERVHPGHGWIARLRD